MRPHGIPFDVSNSLFETQHFLVNGNILAKALWLPNFTPVRLAHLRFVNKLLQTFCALDICCYLKGTYPAYIAGVLSFYYRTRLVVGGLHIIRTDSTILDNIYRRVHRFEIGTFRFRLTEWLEYERFPDYSIYDLTHEGVTVPFQITILDVCAQCGSPSSINLAEFIWEYVSVFAVKMYAIFCVPLDTPTVLYLNHHKAVSDGWTSDTFCDECLEVFRLLPQPFLGNCTHERSCECNVCSRQPPSLRRLASHTVFHLTLHLSNFTLTGRTLHHQYLFAMESNIVR